MKFGAGPLKGVTLAVAPDAERTVRSATLQAIRLQAADALDAERRLLMHRVGGEPLAVVIARGWIDRYLAFVAQDGLDAMAPHAPTAADARAAGFVHSHEDCLALRRELADGPHGDCWPEPAVLKGHTYRWTFGCGEDLVVERHHLHVWLWRVVSKPCAECPSPVVDHARSSTTAPLGNVPGGDPHPDPAPAAAGSLPVAAGALDLEAAHAELETEVDLAKKYGPAKLTLEPQTPLCELSDEQLNERFDPPVRGEPTLVGPDVQAAVAELEARQLARAKAAAEATLLQAGKLLLVSELMLAGGVRRAPNPGVMCCWCAKSLGSYEGVYQQVDDGTQRWAHMKCTTEELERARGPYGTLVDMRTELGAAGVDLTGGESFHELEAAILAARRRDVRSVDWAKKKPITARKQRPCALCPALIEKGQPYFDGVEDRAAHQDCVALLTKGAA